MLLSASNALAANVCVYPLEAGDDPQKGYPLGDFPRSAIELVSQHIEVDCPSEVDLCVVRLTLRVHNTSGASARLRVELETESLDSTDAPELVVDGASAGQLKGDEYRGGLAYPASPPVVVELGPGATRTLDITSHEFALFDPGTYDWPVPALYSRHILLHPKSPARWGFIRVGTTWPTGWDRAPLSGRARTPEGWTLRVSDLADTLRSTGSHREGRMETVFDGRASDSVRFEFAEPRLLEQGGPYVAAGATLGSESHAIARMGYEVALSDRFPEGIVSLSAEVGSGGSVAASPALEVAMPYPGPVRGRVVRALIPSLSVGLGPVFRIAPAPRAGVRLLSGVAYPVIGGVFSADLWFGQGAPRWETALIARISL